MTTSNSPGPSRYQGDAGVVSQRIFSSLLRASSSTSNAITNTPDGALAGPSTAADHHDRIADKRLQLSNPDRPRPRAEAGSHGERKLKKRDRRVRREMIKPIPASLATHRTDQNTSTSSKRSLKRRDREQDEIDYASLLPLHHLWTSYIQQFLGLIRPPPSTSGTSSTPTAPIPPRLTHSTLSSVQSSIVKADLLAARIHIVRASNPSYVGVRGLVARETEKCFVIAQDPESQTISSSASTFNSATASKKKEKRLFKTVPKRNTTIVISVPLPTSPIPSSGEPERQTQPQTQMRMIEVPMDGNHLTGTMVTRATRKWKPRVTMDY